MARLTVENCKFDHFELVVLTAERTKARVSGAASTISTKNKHPVAALREIEMNNIDIEKIKEKIIAKNQMHGEPDRTDEENPATEEDTGFASDIDYTPGEHDLAGLEGLDVEGFDNDNIFSDDISEGTDKS